MKPNSHSHYHQLPATPQGFHVLSCNYLFSGNPTIQQKKSGNPTINYQKLLQKETTWTQNPYTITQPSPPHIFFKQIISSPKTVFSLIFSSTNLVCQRQSWTHKHSLQIQYLELVPITRHYNNHQIILQPTIYKLLWWFNHFIFYN